MRAGADPVLVGAKGEEIFITQAGETATGSRDGKPEELTDVGYVPHNCPERDRRR